MSCTAKLLGSVAGSVDRELKPRLQGFLGGMVRAYLPQTWVFRTEEDVASLLVDRDGHASVVEAAAPHPDVTVEIGHARLKAALSSRSSAKLPAGAMKVTSHTAKGRTAYDYLHQRIGL